ncbi:DUF3305 domain-containing protein [Roseomonas sp. PWR1]|uniref:DUF3305 domain-containing protein n=1 Tax=Roseomonas nitratireducens TaxID=2820810 RepID=A0ABS4AQD1_9PROT|nr:DUF3305 domain-containing protein [Neoroseomonas nitratireducens]MBP0463565.1 DUF3305 domain-containing protein [Neoroseomonas nitratireducens]
MTLEVPGTVRIEVGIVAERRPGVTQWSEHAWAAVEVLEDFPDLPPWTVLREDGGRTLFFAGSAEIALHPTDTDNYVHNLQADRPLVWVVLRPAATPSGLMLQTVTVDGGEAHLYADTGADTLEALPMPAGIRLLLERFVAEHHREREFHKRKRDRQDTDSLGRRARVEER